MAAIPFWSAAATQVLAALARFGTSRVSFAHFERREQMNDYVLPDDRGLPDPPRRNVKRYLPVGYGAKEIGRVYAKNGDAATVLVGIITLTSTWLLSIPEVTQPAVILYWIVMGAAIFVCTRLLVMKPHRYRPNIWESIPISPTVFALVLIFMVGGGVAAIGALIGGGIVAPVPSLAP